jgi:16S rRNA (guanine1516-N2)-methyltransferase
MYAEESVGKKAAVKKETQILHRVLGLEEGNNEENNTNLMTSAVQLANQRVVVKRALNAKALSNLRPHHQILGKTQRFDVYLKNQKIVEDKL